MTVLYIYLGLVAVALVLNHGAHRKSSPKPKLLAEREVTR